MVAMKATLFALVAIFVCVLPGKQVDAQQKCKTPVGDVSNWATSVIDYVIAYNISGSKAEQSCYDIIDNNNGPSDDTSIFNYKIGGAAVKRAGSFLLAADKTATLVFEDTPGSPIAIYGEQRPSGLAVFWLCDGAVESTLVAYKSTQPELAAAADDEAKKLTDKNLADYKISRDGC